MRLEDLPSVVSARVSIGIEELIRSSRIEFKEIGKLMSVYTIDVNCCCYHFSLAFNVFSHDSISDQGDRILYQPLDVLQHFHSLHFEIVEKICD